MSEPVGIIELILSERRSLEAALAELLARYNRSGHKSPQLARMIRQLKAEIRDRRKTSRGTRH